MAEDPSPQGQLPLDPPKGPDSAAEIAALKAEIARSGQSMDQRLAAMQQQLASARPPVDPGSGDQVNNQMWQMLQNDPKQLLNAQQAVVRQHLAAFEQQQRLARLPQDRQIARQAVLDEPDNAELFKAHGKDIEAYIEKMWPSNPDAFTHPDVWRTAADAVRGQKRFNPEKPAADPGAPGKPSPKPMAASKGKDDEPLNENEQHVAENVFGIDHATYAKHKRIDKEQRDPRTQNGRAMLQSPLAKMTYIDKRRSINGMPNPLYGMVRPLMTFDSVVQKPRFPAGANE